MAITDTQICNLAFNKLGHEKAIIAIGESTREGSLTLRYYDYVRDTLLAEHTWNFAIARVALSADASAPLFEYTTQYLLPADFIRPIALYNERAAYKIEVKSDGTKRLLTDASNVNLIYVMKQTDVAQFSPAFVDLFVTRLAAEMAEVITNDSNRAIRLFQEAELKLKKAKRIDGQSGTPGRIRSLGFTGSKRSNVNRFNPTTTY